MMHAAVGWMLAVVLLLSFDATAAGIDVRLVIDVSGSMKSGDPEYLRQDVLNGVGEMLPTGSRAGVWTFGRMTDVVVPHGPVDDAWRRNARAARSTIGTKAPRTDLNDALMKAAWDMGSKTCTTLFQILDAATEDIQLPNIQQRVFGTTSDFKLR